MKKLILFALIFCFLLANFNLVLAQGEKAEIYPHTITRNGLVSLATEENKSSIGVGVNFFYSSMCSHCAKEEKFLDGLEGKYSEIQINRLEISGNIDLLSDLYNKYNVPLELRGSVPVVFVQDRYFVGYSESQNKEIENCVLGFIETQEEESCEAKEKSKTIELPLVGKINVGDYSLPVLSAILGFLDGFNVCSLGALILILALILSFKSRRNILIFGGFFILTTSVVYGFLIIIWYKIFSFLVPYLEWMKLFIGVLGIIGGVYFLREFIRFKKRGAACEIKAGNKIITKLSSIFKKSLEESKNILLVLGVVFVFAGVVTVIEFPCSSVVPLFFAGILADSDLSSFSYLSYIAIFISFYMFDEIIIFLIAFFTMTLWLASGKFVTLITLIQAIVLFALGLYYLFGFNILV